MFLGCFCGESGTNSILNPFSSFGSRYSSTSIFNHFSDFGSRYSDYSACSRYATDPPIIVTGDGRGIGRLTLNRYAASAIADERVVTWLVGVCED